MRPFAYQRAHDTAEAVSEGKLHTAAFLAGGTTLLDLMKLDVARPEHVIDITPLSRSHAEIRVDNNALHLGALARMAEVADHPAVKRDYPVIAQSLDLAAS